MVKNAAKMVREQNLRIVILLLCIKLIKTSCCKLLQKLRKIVSNFVVLSVVHNYEIARHRVADGLLSSFLFVES